MQLSIKIYQNKNLDYIRNKIMILIIKTYPNNEGGRDDDTTEIFLFVMKNYNK